MTAGCLTTCLVAVFASLSGCSSKPSRRRPEGAPLAPLHRKAVIDYARDLDHTAEVEISALVPDTYVAVGAYTYEAEFIGESGVGNPLFYVTTNDDVHPPCGTLNEEHLPAPVGETLSVCQVDERDWKEGVLGQTRVVRVFFWHSARITAELSFTGRYFGDPNPARLRQAIVMAQSVTVEEPSPTTDAGPRPAGQELPPAPPLRP